MSFISRVWNAIRNPVRYVGRDLEGNKFYECRSPNDPSYTKRTVQYFDSEEVWRYIGGGKRLPIQWSAWLSHTRKNPPTIEELQADVLRQQRVLANVALIGARDRAEAEEMLRIRQTDAQLALADASAQARGERVPADTSKEPVAASTSFSTPASNPTISPNNAADNAVSPSPKVLDGNVKVLPPSFLTPSTPRKSRSSAPFSPPKLNADDAASAPETNPNSAPQSPWTSKPQVETESWTPKAVRRG